MVNIYCQSSQSIYTTDTNYQADKLQSSSKCPNFLTQIVKCIDQNKAEGLSNLEYDGEKFKWRNNLTELKKICTR